jgi:hypothetical protein
MLDGEVDPVAGGAILGGQFQAVPQEGVADVYLERVQRRLVQDLIAEVRPVRLDILQVLAQQLDAFGGRALGVHVPGGERRDEREPVLGPGDGHVEAAFPALGEQGPEPVDKVAAGVLAVADGQDDGVAFVALDALQVLDEEPFLAVLVDELSEFFGQLRVLAQAPTQALLDLILVPDPHRDHAQRLTRPFEGMPEDQVHDGFRLGRRTVRLGAGLPRDRHVMQDLVPADSGERDERPVIDVR